MSILSSITGSVKRTFDTDPVLSFSRMVEYKRQNLWILLYKDIPAWSLSEAERPRMSLGEAKIFKYINTYEKVQNGNGEWQPISITLNDPIVPSSAEMVFDLIKKQFHKNEARVGYKRGNDGYAEDFEIRVLHPNGYVVESWFFKNAFLTGEIDFNVNPLSYEDAKQLKLKFQLDYDDCRLITGGKP